MAISAVVGCAEVTVVVIGFKFHTLKIPLVEEYTCSRVCKTCAVELVDYLLMICSLYPIYIHNNIMK